MARTSNYNEKIGNKIINQYASGTILEDVLKPTTMPTRMTVFNWRRKYTEFGNAFDLAMAEHANALIDKAFKVVMNADIKSAKLADVQQRFLTWCASKLNRKQYGDKIDIDVRQTIDISESLALAVSRMRSIGTGQSQNKLIEADVTE